MNVQEELSRILLEEIALELIKEKHPNYDKDVAKHVIENSYKMFLEHGCEIRCGIDASILYEIYMITKENK